MRPLRHDGRRRFAHRLHPARALPVFGPSLFWQRRFKGFAFALLNEGQRPQSAMGGAEAMNLVRRLIDRIVLNPVADGKGGTALSIDLHGHLANILSLGLKAKKPLNSGPEIKYLKLVAGARFDTYVRVAFG